MQRDGRKVLFIHCSFTFRFRNRWRRVDLQPRRPRRFISRFSTFSTFTLWMKRLQLLVNAAESDWRFLWATKESHQWMNSWTFMSINSCCLSFGHERIMRHTHVSNCCCHFLLEDFSCFRSVSHFCCFCFFFWSLSVFLFVADKAGGCSGPLMADGLSSAANTATDGAAVMSLTDCGKCLEASAVWWPDLTVCCGCSFLKLH